MKTIWTISFLPLFLLVAMTPAARAGTEYDAMRSRYPKATYIIGVGEVQKSAKPYNDRKVAEAMARLDLAKQIKVHIQSQKIDVMCESTGSGLFKDRDDCRNYISSTVEISVDLFLKGSRIVEQGEKDGAVFAVAVLERVGAAGSLEEKAGMALDRAKEELEKAKQGDREALQRAREEYKQALVYDREKEAIDGVRSRAAALFAEMERELRGIDVPKDNQPLVGIEDRSKTGR